MIAFPGSQHLEGEGQGSQEWEGGCSSASPWFSVAHDSLLGLESSPDALLLHGLPGQQSVSASAQAHPSCPVLLVVILLVWLEALVPLRVILPLTGFLVPCLTHQNNSSGI